MWDACSATCDGGTQERIFEISVETEGTGAQCEFDEDATQTQACNTQSCAVDCEGSWSECTSACEMADSDSGYAERSWTETVAQEGSGAACPAATSCTNGEGACEITTDTCIANSFPWLASCYAAAPSVSGSATVTPSSEFPSANNYATVVLTLELSSSETTVYSVVAPEVSAQRTCTCGSTQSTRTREYRYSAHLPHKSRQG